MSAFGGKADMTLCGNPLSRSLLGAKRTCPFALHMSASDPKRTSTALNKQSILLGSSFYDWCLDAGLDLGGFSVIAGRLGAQIVGGCPVAHLTCHFQT